MNKCSELCQEINLLVLYRRSPYLSSCYFVLLCYLNAFCFRSFGTLMTATLDWKGIPAYVISLARGFSAIVGIGATLLYPVMHSWVSTLRTGLWSIWMQVHLYIHALLNLHFKWHWHSPILGGGVQKNNPKSKQICSVRLNRLDGPENFVRVV